MAERIIHNVKNILDGSRFEHRGEIVVIGLGRFGLALGKELSRLGHSVFAIDRDPDLVELHKDEFASTATGDTTNERTLRVLGVDQAKTVIVCIGNNIEASLLTAALLVDLTGRASLCLIARAPLAPHAGVVAHAAGPATGAAAPAAAVIAALLAGAVGLAAELT